MPHIRNHAPIWLDLISNSNAKALIMKKVFYFIIAAMALTGFNSCEGFLSQTSTNEVADSDVFTDAAGLENARIGLYNCLQSQYYYGGYYQLIADAYSDNGTTGGYDNLDLDELGYKEASADNIYIENVWIAIYNTIYTANQILANIDNIQDETLSDEVSDDIKGEALAIRAMAHFDLLRMFGEHWDLSSSIGIPVVTEVLSTDAQMKRNTVSETYNAILADLITAESMLKNDDYRYDPPIFKGPQFMTQTACQALLARVYRSMGDMSNALDKASEVINTGFASMIDGDQVSDIYNTKFSSEAIFELAFNAQDKSQFNALTYAREDALRSEVSFLAAADLNDFFAGRPDDFRAPLLNFTGNDVSIEPDGRTEKYRGEIFQDNSAFIIRAAEMYLIMIEAKGYPAGVTDMISFTLNRGVTSVDLTSSEAFEQALMNERRAELNFEGDRYFDLAHFGKVSEILGDEVLPCLPIPNREIGANGGLLEQYPGY